MTTEPVPLSDALNVCLPGGPPFAVDVQTAFFDLRELAAEVEKAGADRLAYLAHVRDYAAEVYGVSLTLGQADSFSEEVELAYARKKKERRDAMQSLLTWQPASPA